MPITHDPETGWGFTHGSQPYVGYATRDEAAEALYDVERGVEPSTGISPLREAARWLDTHLPLTAIAAARHEMADSAYRWDRTPVEIGRTAAGLPIMGDFDTDGAPFTIEIETEYWSLTAGDGGNLALGCIDGELIELNADEDGIAILRDFASLIAGDTPERLLAFGQQWAALRPPEAKREEAAPQPTLPASPPTREDVLASIDPFIRRTGAAAGCLTHVAMHQLDRDRAERLLNFVEQIVELRGDALHAAVDRLMTT